MAFLDFIKNRLSSKQQDVRSKPQQQRPAREFFSREAAQDKARQRPLEQIPKADKVAAKAVGDRIDGARSVANTQRQTAELTKEQTKDRVLARLERAQGSPLSPTQNQQMDGIDAEKLARAERFVDASVRPERVEPPPTGWPRPRPSWER